MDLETITQIRDLRDSIREQNKSSDRDEFSTETYGTENEYSYKGLIGGLSNLMTDISTLTKATKKFVQISSHKERNQIVQHLTQINTHFTTPVNYIPNFDALKILMRSFNVRNFSERQLEFEEETRKTLELKLQLQDELKAVKKIKTKIDNTNSAIDETFESSNVKLIEINEKLDAIIEKKEDLINHANVLKESNNELTSIKETATVQLEEIKVSMTESKSNEKLITSFANKVQERDNRFTELEQSTEENSAKLVEFEEERKSLLNEAKGLIESAKKALNYKTAEGISASFQEQYDKSNNWKIFGSWILGAVICLVGTLALGVWVLKTSSSDIGLLIGRISLLPLPVIGAIFCANQYTKQKHIIEDYAYKMVLSKAIVGFSEQLKKNGTTDNEEYVHYIKTALGEIHKDPLRKREKGKNKAEKSAPPNLKDLVEVVEKIVNMSKVDP